MNEDEVITELRAMKDSDLMFFLSRVLDGRKFEYEEAADCYGNATDAAKLVVIKKIACD